MPGVAESEECVSTFTVLGTDALVNKLRSIDQGVRTTAAMDAVTAGARQIQNYARINAPVDTGTLRKSIMPERAVPDGNGASIIVGVGVEYGSIQEFGGRTGCGHKAYIKAHPYMRPAINEHGPEIQKAMSDVLDLYLKGV